VSAIEACQLACKSSAFTKNELISIIDSYHWNSANEDFEKLTIQPSAISTLPPTVLKLFPSLRIINANGSNLSSVANFEDNGSNVLETLLLSSNNISHLTDTPFFQLNNLHYLSLSHNKFTKFECENLVGLHNLVILDLSYNPNLVNFKCHFMYVPSLKQLALNNNKLAKVVFTISRSRLQYLYLQNNNLTSGDFLLNDGAFFAHLRSLNILNNSLDNLPLQYMKLLNNSDIPFLAPMLDLPAQPFVTIEEGVFLLLVALCLILSATILVLVYLWNQNLKSSRHPTNDGYPHQVSDDFRRKSSFDDEIEPEHETLFRNIPDQSDNFESYEEYGNDDIYESA
jgi:Leucine rich repeat